MPASAAETFSMTHRQILTILGGLMMGMFLAALDQTIVATAIRTIGDDLHGLSLQAWVTTAYLITSTIATPLYGKLSDIYGRKPLYLISIALFLFGSLLSGTATSMYQLAGYRAVQGLGGGGLMSLAITILGDLLSPRERAKYQAYILAVFGTSSVLGPIIGGFFAGVPSVLGITGWRWIFLVNVPLGVAGFFVIWRVLHLPPLGEQEQCQPDDAGPVAGERARGAPPPAAALLGDQQQRHQSAGQGEGPGPVDPVGDPVQRREVQHAPDDEEPGDPQRHVDQEDPPPAGDAEYRGDAREEAADDRAQHR